MTPPAADSRDTEAAIELLRRFENAVINRVHCAYHSMESAEYGRLAGIADVLRTQLRIRLAAASVPEGTKR